MKYMITGASTSESVYIVLVWKIKLVYSQVGYQRFGEIFWFLLHGLNTNNANILIYHVD